MVELYQMEAALPKILPEVPDTKAPTANLICNLPSPRRTTFEKCPPQSREL